MEDFSVVIPAYNAEQTLGRVLNALSAESPRPAEIIVVDDRSTDRTGALAESLGARVVRTERPGYAGGARNAGWDAAGGHVVVFLDSDLVPEPGWSAAVVRAMDEFPGAVVGSAMTFRPRTPWGWVTHLQLETVYLPLGDAREVRFLSSHCLLVPRLAPVRWDESYGGEDGLFSADALAAGFRLVFDPRIRTLHDHRRESFSDLRRQQRRFAYGFARCARVQREGVRKRIFARVPVHYFALVRLLLIHRRLRALPELEATFVRLLPRMIVAEWALGFSALRYVVRQPAPRGQQGRGFR